MKTILGLALVFSTLTLVLAPDSEAGWRYRRARRGYNYVPAATAQSGSGYRTYSYEPGVSGSTSSRGPMRLQDRAFRDAAFKATGRQ